MRASLLVAVCVLAVGCGPRFRLAKNKLTCSEGFLTWAGGLTNHVLQGNGNGAFAYAPASDVVELVDGYYDLQTGEFWWIEYYTDGAWRVQDHAAGYGTVWPDGDLDIEYLLTIELADESFEELTVREARFGCDVDRRVEDEDGLVEFFHGTFAGGELTYTHSWDEGTREYESEGTRSPDGAWSEQLDVVDGDFEYRLEDEGSHLDLSWRREFERVNAYTSLEGFYEQATDGTITAEYVFDPATGAKQTWVYDIDLQGNGSGTLDQGQQHCELTFEDGDCEATGCNKSGKCEPPLTADTVLVRL